jgi:hypothetical protein
MGPPGEGVYQRNVVRCDVHGCALDLVEDVSVGTFGMV